MQTIGAFEAKTHFSALLEQVAQGEEIMISRRGKLVARLVPIEKTHDIARAKKAISQLRTFAKQNTQPFDWEEWKQFRDEGRGS